MPNVCPNCHRNPPRAPNAVLCQECIDTCPMGPRVALQIEETFRMVIAMGVIPQDGSHPYDKFRP